MDLHVAMVARDDPRAVGAWSGTPASMLAALEERVHVSVVGPLSSWPSRADRALARVARGAGRAFVPGTSPLTTVLLGREVSEWLDRLDPMPDVILAPAGAAWIGAYDGPVPVAYLSDATVERMLDYYPRFTGVTAAARARAQAIEETAIARADLLFYPTRWAGDSAVERYGADPDRVVIAPFGANVPDELLAGIEPRVTGDGTLRMLLVGVDWELKGVPVAVEALRLLRSWGIDARLDVVGCTAPPGTPDAPGLVVHGFVDKSTADGVAELRRLYVEADVLVHPVLAEAYGIAMVEAAAFGTPAVARATGGVPEVVLHGETGLLMPEDGGAGELAALVRRLWEDDAERERLATAAQRRQRSLLHWDVWADTAVEAMARLV